MPQAQKVGFVSLGCPKALVDSERILTQLRFDGYEVSPSYDDAGVVIVNTCGFIDSAKEESLAAIGEALEENGRVLVTGCMGGGEQADLVLQRHPKCWESRGLLLTRKSYLRFVASSPTLTCRTRRSILFRHRA
jgi:ribosomal protein S12 methylthiotransferase